MQYPLELSFKIVVAVPQITVRDATGQLQFYVKQRFFQFKDAATVFADEDQTQPLYQMKADRMLAFCPRYRITDAGGRELGSVKRLKFWPGANYDVSDGDQAVLTIRGQNTWLMVANALLGRFSGDVPAAFVVTRADNTVALTLERRPASCGKFRSNYEVPFRICQIAPLSPAEETRALLSLMMILLMEHNHGERSW